MAAVSGLGRPGLFLLRGLGTIAVGLAGVVSALDPQGTSRLMSGARGLSDTEDFLGSLNLLAGTQGRGAIAALVLLGASSFETVGCVNDLAGTSGLELGEAMRSWAYSGNF